MGIRECLFKARLFRACVSGTAAYIVTNVTMFRTLLPMLTCYQCLSQGKARQGKGTEGTGRDRKGILDLESWISDLES